MKVREKTRGRVLGEVERTNGGAYFAGAWRNDTGSLYTALGAFPSRAQAVAAIHAWHNDQPVVGRIPTQVLIGRRPGGMAEGSPE